MGKMSEHSAGEYFVDLMSDDKQWKSIGLAAIETLLRSIELSKAKTVLQLNDELNVAVQSMKSTDYSSTSIRSASEVFLRFISLASAEQNVREFSFLIDMYKERGKLFIERIAKSRAIISRFARPFVQSNMRILTHSFSKVVASALVDAKKTSINMHIFVTESRPDESGRRMVDYLKKFGLQSTLILDASVGYLMETIDVVLFGAEGVMETGGIINKVGTLMIAMCAKTMNKPVYTMAESIKFVKEYPLNQSDIPMEFKYNATTLKRHENDDNYLMEHPLVDYTPPQYIDLLFTDLGILTPAAVGDELIKLYT